MWLWSEKQCVLSQEQTLSLNNGSVLAATFKVHVCVYITIEKQLLHPRLATGLVSPISQLRAWSVWM